jgi:hypothetical protein
MWGVLWTIVVVLVVLWVIGLALDLFGGLLWWLLVIAGVLLVVNLLFGRRTTV